MSEANKVMIALLMAGGTILILSLFSPPSKLGSCISLNLIKNQVNKSTLGKYCWEDSSGKYCIIRRDK